MTTARQGRSSRSRGATFGGLSALLVALCVAVATAGSSAVAQEAGRGVGPGSPNVLVVMTDDQRADDARVMREVRRRIGRRGTTFTNSFATFPLCCPSRATHVTGQYAHNHGVRDNVPPEGGAVNLDDSQTVATALDDAGYRTGLIGKYLNGYAALFDDTGHIPPGYDRWQAMISAFRVYGWKQLIDGEVFDWGSDLRSYQTDVLTRQAKDFIRASTKDADPFFLTVTTSVPHRENGGNRDARYNPRPARRHKDQLDGYPFPKTKAFNERNVNDKPSFVQEEPRFSKFLERRTEKQRLARLESVLGADDMINSLVRNLKKRGELQDTLIVFTSDNGFQLGEHRLGSKNQVYEESIRVPLVMRGPGVPAGVTIRSPAANIDVPATIFDITNVEPPIEQDGISLFDLIDNPAEYADRDLLIETTRSLAVRTPRYLYAEHDTDPETPQTDDELELYDLATDPYQLESLHEDLDPETIALRLQLAQRLDELRDCAGSECR